MSGEIEFKFNTQKMKQSHIVRPKLFSLSIYSYASEKSLVSFMVNGVPYSFYTTKFKLINNSPKWHYFKIDYRYSGSQCVTSMYVNNMLIFDKTDTCGSFDGSEATVYASCNNCEEARDTSGYTAAGTVDSIRFVWL